VLLVDDHEAELGNGSEHGRARPDADARLAAAQAQPFVVALAVAHARVQHGHGRAEARLETPDDLRGQGDLGHEHDGPAAALQGRGRGAQVDLGLPRAGDAVQEEALGSPRLDRRGHRR
jgi:hypothetical protein